MYDAMMHSTRAGGMAYIHALPTEICTKLHKGKGADAMQKERTSGAGFVGRRKRSQQTLEANKGNDWPMSMVSEQSGKYVWNPDK